MKLILPKDIYSNIKSKFIEEINKSLTSTIHHDDSSSSIFSMIKTPWSSGNSGCYDETGQKNLELSYDFLPIEKENQNRNQNKNTNKKNNFNITQNQSKHSESGTNQSQLKGKMPNYHSQNKKKLFNDKKHSLYSLTKGKNINKTRSNSKSQSNSKEHSAILNKCGGTSSHLSLAKANILNTIALNHKTINNSTVSKQFALGNAVTTSSNKSNIKKSIITKTQSLLNTKLFSKLQSDLLRMEISKCSIDKTQKNVNSKKCSFENLNKKEISKNHSLDKLTKMNSLKQCTIEKSKLQSYRNEKEKENEKNKSRSKAMNKNCSFKLNSTNHQVKLKEVQEYQEKEEYIPNKKNKTSNRKRDNIDIFNEVNEVKSSEQLKEIKSSLDDNLKVMFNFSYECFLNRESESESKMSYEDNTQRGREKNEKNSYSYKKKYKY